MITPLGSRYLRSAVVAGVNADSILLPGPRNVEDGLMSNMVRLEDGEKMRRQH